MVRHRWGARSQGGQMPGKNMIWSHHQKFVVVDNAVRDLNYHRCYISCESFFV